MTDPVEVGAPQDATSQGLAALNHSISRLSMRGLTKPQGVLGARRCHSMCRNLTAPMFLIMNSYSLPHADVTVVSAAHILSGG